MFMKNQMDLRNSCRILLVLLLAVLLFLAS